MLRIFAFAGLVGIATFAILLFLPDAVGESVPIRGIRQLTKWKLVGGEIVYETATVGDLEVGGWEMLLTIEMRHAGYTTAIGTTKEIADINERGKALLFLCNLLRNEPDEEFVGQPFLAPPENDLSPTELQAQLARDTAELKEKQRTKSDQLKKDLLAQLTEMKHLTKDLDNGVIKSEILARIAEHYFAIGQTSEGQASLTESAVSLNSLNSWSAWFSSIISKLYVASFSAFIAMIGAICIRVLDFHITSWVARRMGNEQLASWLEIEIDKQLKSKLIIPND